MNKDLKILILAIAGLAFICIAILAIIYVWNYRAVISEGSSSSSLDFRYSTDGHAPLNVTQYTYNSSFTGHMTVEGTSDTMLIVLQDYNVTAFYYNGSLSKTHMIAKNAYINETGVVTPSGAGAYDDTFNITGIQDGFHDIEFIGFVDPYNYTGAGWRSDGPFTSGGVRFNVIANNSNKTMPAYTDGPSSNDTLYSTTYEFPSGGPSLAKEPFSVQGWKSEKVNGNGTIDYYVNLAHPMFDGKATNYSFAIIQLLDYQQIPVRVGSPETVYYGHIDKNTFASVHISLRAPDVPGNHKLIVIVAGDPYENLEVAPYVENNQTWTTNKNISAFTTIEHQNIIVS